LTGQIITEQVDVYAFGVLLFELLAGIRPIAAKSIEHIFFCFSTSRSTWDQSLKRVIPNRSAT
jgi:serine/threonine protein kinase